MMDNNYLSSDLISISGYTLQGVLEIVFVILVTVFWILDPQGHSLEISEYTFPLQFRFKSIFEHYKAFELICPVDEF